MNGKWGYRDGVGERSHCNYVIVIMSSDHNIISSLSFCVIIGKYCLHTIIQSVRLKNTPWRIHSVVGILTVQRYVMVRIFSP